MFKGVKDSAKAIHSAILEEGPITLYGDYDVDGLCGILSFKTLFELIGFTNFKCVEYTVRTHAIDKKVRSEVLSNNSCLCIIVDTGSGEEDLEELLSLSMLGTVIFADHHEAKYDYHQLPTNVIPVNPTVRDKYPHLSGACVAYEICMEYLRMYRSDSVSIGEKYLSFYAFSALYADSIYGDNSYCRELYYKAEMSILPPVFSNLKYFNISKRFSLFSFAPPLNACFRNGAFYILNALYLRKGILTNTDRESFLTEMDSIRSYARSLVDVLVNKSSIQVIGEFVLIDLSGLLNQAIPNSVVWNNKGLVANKVAGMYKKCCICIVSVGNKYVLSCRDYYNRDMYRLFSALYGVGGHRPAFGGELSFSEVLGLKDKLRLLSGMTDVPQPINEVPFESVNEQDIISIAIENEFKHEKDVVLVRIPRDRLEVVWTPESFSDRYEQFLLQLPTQKVYIKLEEFARSAPSILVHFFKSNRLNGSIVAEKGVVS